MGTDDIKISLVSPKISFTRVADQPSKVPTLIPVERYLCIFGSLDPLDLC